MYQLTQKDYRQISALNAKNGWGFTKQQLMNLLRRYKKAYAEGDERRMALIEERLTDANFHTECGLLADKDFDGFEREVNKTFEE